MLDRFGKLDISRRISSGRLLLFFDFFKDSFCSGGPLVLCKNLFLIVDLLCVLPFEYIIITSFFDGHYHCLRVRKILDPDSLSSPSLLNHGNVVRLKPEFNLCIIAFTIKFVILDGICDFFFLALNRHGIHLLNRIIFGICFVVEIFNSPSECAVMFFSKVC